MTDLYRRPDEYDLEHVGDEEDVVFYVGLAKSLHPKSVLELACGTGRITVPLAEEGARQIRLVRRKTVDYVPYEQRAQIRFLYEKYRRKSLIECYIDDFEGHVYFPRELRLLFLHTGFGIEDVFGDYNRRPLRASSQLMIMIGRKPAGGRATNNGEGGGD